MKVKYLSESDPLSLMYVKTYDIIEVDAESKTDYQHKRNGLSVHFITLNYC